MIKTLYNIGKILKDKEPDWFRPWKDPFAGREESDKIVIVIETENKRIIDEPVFEAYKKSNVDKYLFREAKSNATNLVPTFYYQVFLDKEKQRIEIEKKIKKIKASIKNYKHDFLGEDGIGKIEKILAGLALDNKKRHLLTFKINGKYFGEFEEYRQLFYSDAFSKYSNASKSKSKTCAVTYSNTDEVWGRISTFGFAVTEQAFSRNGFNTTNSYKMFPVSPDVVKILDGTKDFVISNLSKSFSKLNYFILPHFINVSETIQEEILDDFLNKARRKDISLKDESKAVIGYEKLIYEIIESENLSISGIYYDIFFYQINNAQFLIKLHLPDVLPSQFTKIFKAKERVENHFDIITRWEFKDQTNRYYLNFVNIKDFFSEKKQKEIVFHPYFFKVVEAVFYNSLLNEETILKFFLEKIIAGFKKRNENAFLFPQAVKKSLVIYQFFSQLGLFTNKNKDIMKENSFVVLTMDEFIEQHKSLLDSDYAKGVFILGCLVKRLLIIQKRHHNLDNVAKASFTKRLNNLVINSNEIMRIFYEVEAKRLQFKQYYSLFDEDLSKKVFALLAETNNTKQISNDKIRYLFAGGLVMEDEFAKEATRRKKLKKQESEPVENIEN